MKYFLFTLVTISLNIYSLLISINPGCSFGYLTSDIFCDNSKNGVDGASVNEPVRFHHHVGGVWVFRVIIPLKQNTKLRYYSECYDDY